MTLHPVHGLFAVLHITVTVKPVAAGGGPISTQPREAGHQIAFLADQVLIGVEHVLSVITVDFLGDCMRIDVFDFPVLILLAVVPGQTEDWIGVGPTFLEIEFAHPPI